MVEYKGFRIEPFETEPGRRRAKISRSDGRNIRVAVPAGDEHASIKTSPETLSAQAAIDLAKQAIDGGCPEKRDGLNAPARVEEARRCALDLRAVRSIGATAWLARGPPAVMLRRRSDETIFQSLRSRPEMIAS